MNRSAITDPFDPRQLNLEYLRSRLHCGTRLSGYALDPVSAANSLAFRVRLTYESPSDDDPESLFLKLCGGGTFGRSEVDYYTKDYKGLRGAPIPLCYDAVYKNSSYHLLLQDLTATHQNHWEVEPSLVYGKAAARSLAKLHSHYWGTTPLRAAMDDTDIGVRLERYLEEMQRGYKPLMEEIRDGSETDCREVVADVFERHPGAMESRLSTGVPFTLVHGDLNPGNILSSKVRHGEDIYFIDRQPFEWSLLRWVGPSDLSYLMVLWWDVDRRRALELDVLREYHDALVDFGVTDYSWESTLSDYRLSALQCFYVAASWCVDPEQRKSMRWLWSAQLERACAFYRDWHCD